MLYKKILTSEKQAKETYHDLSDTVNETAFKDTLNEMAKLTIYFLLYNGVPANIIPLVLANTVNYQPYNIQREIHRSIKKNNNCLICGSSENLTLHHIKPVREYPELKYRFDNLKPICKQCHKNIHKYKIGGGKWKP